MFQTQDISSELYMRQNLLHCELGVLGFSVFRLNYYFFKVEADASLSSLSLLWTARLPGKHANTVSHSLSPKIFITS